MRDGFYAHGSTWGVVAVDSGQGSFILWAQQWNLSAIMGQCTMSIRWAAWLDFLKSSSWLISVYGGAFLKNYMNSIRSWKQLFFLQVQCPGLKFWVMEEHVKIRELWDLHTSECNWAHEQVMGALPNQQSTLIIASLLPWEHISHLSALQDWVSSGW